VPVSGSDLWPAFVTVIFTVAILLIAVSAALIIGHRRLVVAHARFTRQLVKAQDRERERISAEVHDELGTQVALIRNELANYRVGSGLQKGEPGTLEGVEEELGGLGETIRSLAHRLHPTRVDQAGLPTALLNLQREVEGELGLQVHFNGLQEPLPRGPTGWAVYRITQEALRNAARHGGATEAWVALRVRGHTLDLEIRDRGRGFELQDRQARDGGGIGLHLMRERAGVVGGQIRFESRPGAGTVVHGRFPLSPVSSDA
jgi:signal transduction histidine kinase